MTTEIGCTHPRARPDQSEMCSACRKAERRRIADASVWSRFWSNVAISESGCWEWQGWRRTGYGIFQIKSQGVRTGAHRWIYAQVHGPIANAMDIDHLCRNPACVRLDHLEAVTHRENMRRGGGLVGERARQKHCARGHAFDEKNTRLEVNGTRRCRECYRMWKRARAPRLHDR